MIVIKIGGSVVDGLHPSTLADIKTIAGKEKLVFVHGGGKEVTSTAMKLGKEQKFIVSPGGVRSRYTDKETAEIYTMVMSGKINKAIVGMLLRQGIKAVGIAGIDGSVLKAERKKKLRHLNTTRLKSSGTLFFICASNEKYCSLLCSTSQGYNTDE